MRPFDNRPIDKFIKVNDIGIINDATQQNKTLFTAVCPTTIFGLRWTIGIRNSEAAASTLVHWVIALLPEGQTQPTMLVGDGDDFFQPEQNAMAFGVVRCGFEASSNAPNVFLLEGSVKTKRKLRIGDTLVLSMVYHEGTASVIAQWDSLIMFFTKG